MAIGGAKLLNLTKKVKIEWLLEMLSISCSSNQYNKQKDIPETVSLDFLFLFF
jgi:hypothetical protein